VNRSTETTAPDHSARIARAAWLCAFVLPLLLATLLLGVKSAQAATPSPPSVVPLVIFDEEEELEEEDEGEFAEEECAIAEEELAEGLLTAADVEELCAEEATGGASSEEASECPIRSIRAHAVQHNNRLKLTIGYTTNAPTAATVQIRGVGTFKRHLGKSGVLRFSERVGRKQAKRIKIRIRVPSSAGGRGCGLVQVVANKVV
jgi:hypothetical protein